jgi:hypothetical protein
MGKGGFITQTPLTIPGCAAWIDFSDTRATNIVSSSNLISRINDKSGNGNYASQATGVRQPSTGVLTQSGLNVAGFSGGQFLQFVNNDPLDEPFTVFVVGKSNSQIPGQDQAFIGRQTSSIAGQWVLIRNAIFAIFQSYLFGDGGLDSGATTVSNSDYNVHTVSFFNGGRLNMQLNNGTAALGNVRSGYNNSNTTGLCIGASNPSMGTPLIGSIAEIIIYRVTLSSTQKATIARYLANKWGIAIS